VVPNPVAQVCRVAAVEPPDEVQLDVVGVPRLEQPAAGAQQDRDEMDLHLGVIVVKLVSRADNLPSDLVKPFPCHRDSLTRLKLTQVLGFRRSRAGQDRGRPSGGQ
jgi:hypothetical protein